MKQTKSSEANSVKKVIFFCLFVLILISISLGIRLVTLIRSSTFDGDHRYTIEIKKNEQEAKIISLDPTSKKMLILYVKSNENLPKLALPLGVPIDAVVKRDTSLENSVTKDFSDLLFNLHVNGYDMVRLIAASKTISEEDTVRYSFPFPVETDEYEKKVQDLLIDSGIQHDNKTVAIINASDVSGIGSRFGQLVENAGGTVIAVNSSPSISEKTTITYYGEKSYTVGKLERFLGIQAVQKEGQGLSNIEITLGTNAEKGMKE